MENQEAFMLETQHVSKHYGKLEVLKDINLQVKKGEVICLIGPSGAGKSTYLRSLNQLETITGGKIFIKGHLLLHREQRQLDVDGEPVKLTPKEYRIVELLMSNPGRVFSAEEIYERVWNETAYSVENTIMVHIRRIREKIEINPKEPRYLKVVWGVGYKIEKQP